MMYSWAQIKRGNTGQDAPQERWTNETFSNIEDNGSIALVSGKADPHSHWLRDLIDSPRLLSLPPVTCGKSPAYLEKDLCDILILPILCIFDTSTWKSNVFKY